jgi:hypothetical protein
MFAEAIAMSVSTEPPSIFETVQAFLKSPDVTRDDIWQLVHRFQSAGDRAEDSFRKRSVSLITIWLVAYGIAANIVSEGSFSSFKLSNLSLVCLIAPFALALLQHDAISIILASTIVGRIERACYKKLFPGTNRDQADAITPSASGLALEGMITGRTFKTNGFLWLTSGLMLIVIFVGPYLLVAHASYLAIAATKYPVWAKILVMFATGVVVFRAALLLVALFKAPHVEAA